MLTKFKMRFLMVIMVVAITGLIIQSNHYSKDILIPVIEYIMEPNADFESAINTFFNLHLEPEEEDADIIGTNVLWQMPCQYNKIMRNYGWFWDIENNRQEFNPGIYLQVSKNTPVNSILNGVVKQIKNSNGRSIIFISNGDTTALIGGIDKVLVQAGQKVTRNSLLGHSSDTVYVEVRKQDSPINPDVILQ